MPPSTPTIRKPPVSSSTTQKTPASMDATQKPSQRLKKNKAVKTLFGATEESQDLVRPSCLFKHKQHNINSVVLETHARSITYCSNSSDLRTILHGKERIPIMQDYYYTLPNITGAGLGVTVKWGKRNPTGCLWMNTQCILSCY